MEKTECTLCGSRDTKYIPNQIRNDTKGQFKMYRCACCETHFLYPRPKSTQLQEYYDGVFREEVHSESYYDEETLDRVFRKFLPEAELRAKRVAGELKQEDEILEIGCSVGYFLDAAAERVQAVYGTEWDKKAQQYIKEHLNQSNIQVSDNPEDFNRKFNKIFMFHVLEHIEEPVSFLKNLKKLLKSDGRIYIEVPNVDDILVKTYECEAFKNYYYKKAHLYNFNEKGLAYIFEHAGYQYRIDFIQRYDLSNHLYWMGKGLPGGKGKYKDILGEAVNDEYIKALKRNRQTDTLFAVIWV